MSFKDLENSSIFFIAMTLNKKKMKYNFQTDIQLKMLYSAENKHIPQFYMNKLLFLRKVHLNVNIFSLNATVNY